MFQYQIHYADNQTMPRPSWKKSFLSERLKLYLLAELAYRQVVLDRLYHSILESIHFHYSRKSQTLYKDNMTNFVYSFQ